MLRLLLNADLYTPERLGRRHLLVAGGKVVWIGEERPEVGGGVVTEEIDLAGARLVPGLIDVNVTNNTGSDATLYGWIDYDGDGTFDNATERSSVPVPTGSTGATVTLVFPAVPWLSPAVTDTYARFRLSTDTAAANPTGAAADGEVEDHPVQITYASVADRHVFYDGSYWDGNTAGANVVGGPGENGDDGAIATDKWALLPGGTATTANYTTYSKGINGIMVDVAGLANPTAVGDDVFTEFDFKVGNDNTPSGWTTAAAPSDVDVRDLGGGVSRISFFWAAGAIPTHNWLQVTVKADADTGLATPDVFYFGSAIGDATGDGWTLFGDLSTVFGLIDSGGTDIEDHGDINRDGFTLFGDMSLVFANIDSEEKLVMITTPAPPSTPPGSALTDGAFGEGEMFWAAQLAADWRATRSWPFDQLPSGDPTPADAYLGLPPIDSYVGVDAPAPEDEYEFQYEYDDPYQPALEEPDPWESTDSEAPLADAVWAYDMEDEWSDSEDDDLVDEDAADDVFAMYYGE